MKAIVFDEANFDYKLSKYNDGSMAISDPPSFRGSQGAPGSTQLPCIVLCYEVTDKDLHRMRETNRLWLIITGTALPPITIQSEHPFIINRGEETAGQDESEEKKALSKQAEIILRYEDVIKRCQRILGEQVDPLSKMEPEEAISQLLSILDNKDFCDFMDKGRISAKEYLNDCLPEAMRIVRTELAKDKREGSYYHSWQCNIVSSIMNAFTKEVGVVEGIDLHKILNFGSKLFLNTLIGDEGDLKSVTVDSGKICGPKEVVMAHEVESKIFAPNREKEEEIIRYGGRNAGKVERSKMIGILSGILNMEGSQHLKIVAIIELLEQKLGHEIKYNTKEFDPGEIQIIQEELQLTHKKLDDACATGNDAVSLLRECVPATLDTPELQQRIIDFLKQK